jgi:hypothetical protein
MKIANVLSLVLVPGLLLACAPDDTDEPWADPAAEAPPPEERREVRDIGLSDMFDSGVTGEAQMTAVGAQHEVMVRMENAQPNTSYQGGVYRGTCDEPMDRVAQLQAIETNAMGAGSATSTVNIPMVGDRPAQPTQQDTLPRTDRDDRDMVIIYHRGDTVQQGVLCGSIDGNRGIF